MIKQSMSILEKCIDCFYRNDYGEPDKEGVCTTCDFFPYKKVKPIDQTYMSVNFETIRKCPKCGTDVKNAINYVGVHPSIVCPNCKNGLIW